MRWKTFASIFSYLFQPCGCFGSLVLPGVESNNGLFFPLKQSNGNLKTLEEQALEEDVMLQKCFTYEMDGKSCNWDYSMYPNSMNSSVQIYTTLVADKNCTIILECITLWYMARKLAFCCLKLVPMDICGIQIMTDYEFIAKHIFPPFSPVKIFQLQKKGN